MPNFGELKPKLMEGDLDLHASINCFEHINDSVTIVFACTATYTAITERRRRCRVQTTMRGSTKSDPMASLSTCCDVSHLVRSMSSR